MKDKCKCCRELEWKLAFDPKNPHSVSRVVRQMNDHFFNETKKIFDNMAKPVLPEMRQRLVDAFSKLHPIKLGLGMDPNSEDVAKVSLTYRELDTIVGVLGDRLENDREEDTPPKGLKPSKKLSEGFINETELDFKDISSEANREYLRFSENLIIDGAPLYLNVSKSGGHRLFTDTGWCYYVQPKEGWATRWKVKAGKPSFVK